jgi:hypothetical protein
MTKIDDLVNELRKNPSNVRFSDLSKVCDHYFGNGRQKGSHCIYKTPWVGDPRINIQEGKNGKAKAYQVKQVLRAIDKLKE